MGDGWYQSRKEDGTDLEMIQVKFHKYMVDYFGFNTSSKQELKVPRQRFASFVAAEIFESARHHATYRFILQDRLTGRDLMMVRHLQEQSSTLFCSRASRKISDRAFIYYSFTALDVELGLDHRDKSGACSRQRHLLG